MSTLHLDEAAVDVIASTATPLDSLPASDLPEGWSAAELSEHLSTCSACAAAVAEARNFFAGLAEPAVADPALGSLLASVDREIRQATPVNSPDVDSDNIVPLRRRSAVYSVVALAAAALVGLLLLGPRLPGERGAPAAADPVAAEAAASDAAALGLDLKSLAADPLADLEEPADVLDLQLDTYADLTSIPDLYDPEPDDDCLLGCNSFEGLADLDDTALDALLSDLQPNNARSRLQ